jgi:rod shape-determining protein MreC
VLALVIVLLGKAEAGIFDGVRAKLTDWMAPVLEGVREPLAGIQKWVSSAGDVFTVYDENVRLKQEVAELRKWQEVAHTLQTRLQRYEILLKAVPDAELPSIQARVIGQSNRPFIKTMILNAGETQGVKAGQAVVDDRGLIGRIYVTGDSTSWVILLGDLNSRVPVTIAPSSRRAMLTGDNSTAPSLALDSGLTDVHAGDHVYSSGDGGQLPPGLPVGVVVDDGGSFRVSLFADPDSTDFVHVIDYSVPPQPPPGTAAAEMPISPPTPPAPAPQIQTPSAATPHTTPATTPARTTAAATPAHTTAPTHRPAPHRAPVEITPAPMALPSLPEPTARDNSGDDEMDQ